MSALTWALGIATGLAVASAQPTEPDESARERASDEATEGAEDPDTEAPEEQREVVVGIYVNQIPSLDIRAHQFTIDFWIWFRWRGAPDRDPAETFELVGGRVNARMHPIRLRLADGYEYSSLRVHATIAERWDLSRFPFDDHDVSVVVEDSLYERHEWVYVPDVENSQVDPDLVLSGWMVGDLTSSERTHTYRTNYGDTTTPTGAATDFSRAEFTLKLTRVGAARFFKVFFGLFVATLAAWTACFIRPRDPAPRVAVSIGSLFAGAASSFAVNGQLPDSSEIMLADAVVFLSLGTILFCLVVTVLSLHFHYNGQESRHRFLDRFAGAAVPTFFVGALIWLVWGAG